MPASLEQAAPRDRSPALWRRLREGLLGLVRQTGRDPFAIVGVSIFIAFAAVAALADVIATHDPLEIQFLASGQLAANQRPGAAFLLGTTSFGRDIFSQLIYGTRSALFVGLSAAIFVASLGTLVGLVSGYFGGRIDALLMRIADMALSFLSCRS